MCSKILLRWNTIQPGSIWHHCRHSRWISFRTNHIHDLYLSKSHSPSSCFSLKKILVTSLPKTSYSSLSWPNNDAPLLPSHSILDNESCSPDLDLDDEPSSPQIPPPSSPVLDQEYDFDLPSLHSQVPNSIKPSSPSPSPSASEKRFDIYFQLPSEAAYIQKAMLKLKHAEAHFENSKSINDPLSKAPSDSWVPDEKWWKHLLKHFRYAAVQIRHQRIQLAHWIQLKPHLAQRLHEIPDVVNIPTLKEVMRLMDVFGLKHSAFMNHMLIRAILSLDPPDPFLAQFHLSSQLALDKDANLPINYAFQLVLETVKENRIPLRDTLERLAVACIPHRRPDLALSLVEALIMAEKDAHHHRQLTDTPKNDFLMLARKCTFSGRKEKSFFLQVKFFSKVMDVFADIDEVKGATMCWNYLKDNGHVSSVDSGKIERLCYMAARTGSVDLLGDVISNSFLSNPQEYLPTPLKDGHFVVSCLVQGYSKSRNYSKALQVMTFSFKQWVRKGGNSDQRVLDAGVLDPLVDHVAKLGVEEVQHFYQIMKEHLGTLPKLPSGSHEKEFQMAAVLPSYFSLVKLYYQALIAMCQRSNLKEVNMVSLIWSDLVKPQKKRKESREMEATHFEQQVVDRDMCHSLLTCCIQSRLLQDVNDIYRYMSTHSNVSCDGDTYLLLFEFCLYHSDETQFLPFYSSHPEIHCHSQIAEDVLPDLARYFLSKLELEKDHLTRKALMRASRRISRATTFTDSSNKKPLIRRFTKMMEMVDENSN